MNVELLLNNVHTAGWTLNLLFKSLFVLILGWLLIKISGKSSAPIRSSITMVTIFVFVLLPFTFFISPVFDAWEFDTAITIEAVYPKEALDRKLQGEILIELNTGIYGRVLIAKHVKGKHKILNDAALKAVKHWVYEPYILNGVPWEAN